MAGPPRTEEPEHNRPDPSSRPLDLAAEAERARTPREPFLALAGVWVFVVAALVIVLALVALTLYFVT
jgi:hypothetical protein